MYLYVIYIRVCLYVNIHKDTDRPSGESVRETGVPSQVESYQRLRKMILDVSLLKTQHYKGWVKGSGAIQGKEKSPSLHLSVAAIEKGPSGHL